MFLANHFQRCTKKQEADFVNQRAFCHAYGYSYRPYYFVPSQSYHDGFDELFNEESYCYGNPTFDQSSENAPLISQKSDRTIRRQVNIEIGAIESRLQRCRDGSPELRYELKRLLLIWHPDKAMKNKSGDLSNPHCHEVVNEVFRYVDGRWKEFNNTCHNTNLHSDR